MKARIFYKDIGVMSMWILRWPCGCYEYNLTWKDAIDYFNTFNGLHFCHKSAIPITWDLLG